MTRPTAKPNDPYVSKVVKYVPTEIIAGYVALSGFIKLLPGPQQFTWFCIVSIFLLLITPLYLSAATNEPGKKSSLAHPVAGALAFAAWVFATGGPFERFQMSADGTSGWYHRALGSIVLVLICLSLPLIERFFPQPKGG
jgi:hypothetical protein